MRVQIFSFLIILVFISSILPPGLKADLQKETNLNLNYVDHDPIVITDDSELANISTSGSGTSIDPYIIESLRIVTNDETAISISSTTKYFEIRNCYFSTGKNNSAGIKLSISESTCKIINNTFFSCSDGIAFSIGASLIKDNSFISVGTGLEQVVFFSTKENYTLIENNGFIDCTFGIWSFFGEKLSIQNNFFESCYMAINNQIGNFFQILNNHFNYNSYGFYGWGFNFTLIGNLFENSMYEDFEIVSDYTLLEANTFNNKGLFKVGGFSTITNNTFKSGLDMRESTGSVIANNSFEGGPYGLMLTNSDNCSIYDNHFINNLGYALALKNGSNNYIHHNIFEENNDGNVQARDDGSDNFWYDPLTNTGNYWSDYSNEEPYEIDGSANAIDPYPEEVATASEFNFNYFFAFPVIISLVILVGYKRKIK